jgi:hypothetical protein
VKQAIQRRQRRPREATALATSIRDQLMQKLVEWVLLRQPESEVGFERYVAFISTNPEWPSIPLFSRRAQVKLSQEAGARCRIGTTHTWRRTDGSRPQEARGARGSGH